MSQTLRKERETYDRLKAGWLADGLEGRYVVISGEDVLGFYGSLSIAVDVAYDAWGLGRTFMVRQVRAVESVCRVNRPVVSVDEQKE